jgi:hypothetical protein
MIGGKGAAQPLAGILIFNLSGECTKMGVENNYSALP